MFYSSLKHIKLDSYMPMQCLYVFCGPRPGSWDWDNSHRPVPWLCALWRKTRLLGFREKAKISLPHFPLIFMHIFLSVLQYNIETLPNKIQTIIYYLNATFNRWTLLKIALTSLLLLETWTVILVEGAQWILAKIKLLHFSDSTLEVFEKKISTKEKTQESSQDFPPPPYSKRVFLIFLDFTN